jgi:hypothetical protein
VRVGQDDITALAYADDINNNHELDKEFEQPECPKCHEDKQKQIALRWSHDQKTRRPTTI